jgi:hypothetical protein
MVEGGKVGFIYLLGTYTMVQMVLQTQEAVAVVEVELTMVVLVVLE